LKEWRCVKAKQVFPLVGSVGQCTAACSIGVLLGLQVGLENRFDLTLTAITA
jgi:hypothetical protein